MRSGWNLTCTALLVAIFVAYSGCDKDESDSLTIGGETNLELTKVGNLFPIALGTAVYMPGLENLKDSIVITRNDGGLVTVSGILKFDTSFTNALGTSLGITALPGDMRHSIIDTYVKRFSASIDTSNKKAMTASAYMKLRVTSEGIQEYHNSRGDINRPFTIVKYGSNVGDKYEFTNADGVAITRTVTYKSTTDDYDIGFWRIKVIKVEETKSDPLMQKITYVANHKFGLVGVILNTTNGKEVKLTIFPPTL